MRRLLDWLRGLPISVRLVALALLPLIGLSVFSVSRAADEWDRVTAARELRDQAQLVAMLSEASTEVEREIDSFLGIVEARQSFDVELGGLSAGFGFDFQGGLIASQDEVDLALIRLSTVEPNRWADPEAVRTLIEGKKLLEAIRAAYLDETLDAELLDQADTGLRAAITDAISAQSTTLAVARDQLAFEPEVGQLLNSAAQTQTLVTTARSERRALAAYLLPLLDPTDASDRDRRDVLAVEGARFDATYEQLKETAPPTIAEHLAEREVEVGWIGFEQLRQQATSGELWPATADDGLSYMAPMGVVVFLHGFQRIEHLATVNTDAAELVAVETSALEQAAAKDFVLSVLLGLILALATAVGGLVTLKSISRPVRRLERRARRITEGDLHHPDRATGGPRDLRLIDDALDQMTTNLRMLSAQTEALSEGRLDDEVLSTPVVGPIGASVHGSVHRLRRMTARLEHEATHDQLTGLPNRAALLSLLDRCLTGELDRRVPLSVIMLDLDGFKAANDVLGHPIGDEILVHVGQRLSNGAAESFVARLGGDEFMVVNVGEDRVAGTEVLAGELVSSLAQPMSTSGGVVAVSACAGIVATDRSAWLTPTEILRRVDLALYEAKASDETKTVMFDQRLHDSLLQTARVQNELRQALAADEFELHVQGVVDSDTLQVSGFEALLRWQPEGRPPVSPAVFIPVAEQSDLIIDIDRWVLRRGAALLAEWARNPATAHLTLSVNISGRHVSSPELVTSVANAINDYSLDASKLTIEVTESQLIPNLARAEHVLRSLRDLGVKLAIDDFGTGYASVAHLRHVKFDRLKIDRSFLLALEDDTERSLATLLVSLGRDLKLDVVAEGIETEQQLLWAVEAGCSHLQGFRFSIPALPATAVPELLASNA